MTTPNWSDGKRRTCIGSHISYGDHASQSMDVCETPAEVEHLRKTAEDDMLELHSQGDPNVSSFVDRHKIIAVSPRWKVLED